MSESITSTDESSPKFIYIANESFLFTAVVACIARTTDARWQRAYNKAWRELLSHPALEWDGARLYAPSRRNSARIYAATSASCQCDAGQYSKPCWHVAGAQIMERYDAMLRVQRANVVDGGR